MEKKKKRKRKNTRTRGVIESIRKNCNAIHGMIRAPRTAMQRRYRRSGAEGVSTLARRRTPETADNGRTMEMRWKAQGLGKEWVYY